MSDRSFFGDASSTRAEIRVLNGIVYAGLIGLLLVFGVRMFVIDEKSENTTQQTAEAPVTAPAPAAGLKPSDDETKRSSRPVRPDLFGG
jgi:hypothetical protein